MPDAPRTVLVVGAGFSGVAVTLQLMRRCGPETTLILVNESGLMARGLAYGTHSAVHMLNVPAGNMSADPDDPDAFLRFCRTRLPDVSGSSFVLRRVYGDYLESLLEACEQAAGGPRLQRLVGRVASVRPGAGSRAVRVTLEDGRLLQVDDVVLAFGHFPPRNPLSPADAASAAEAVVGDPWRPGALEAIAPDAPVLLIGAGLTAMDVVLALQRQQHRGGIVSVSRHGLAPIAHRAHDGPPGPVDLGVLSEPRPASLRRLMARLRADVRACEREGRNWRDVIGALRPHTPQLWAALSQADQARFLRHVRPYWEVHRHRCAPQAHAELQRLASEGRFEALAGRITAVSPEGPMRQVSIRLRGGGPTVHRAAVVLVNCTGPSTDVTRSRSALVRQLLNEGLLGADRHGLGVDVDARYRVIGRDGAALPWLYYIGPMLRATYWEATAVPELRAHAARLAQELTERR